VAERQGRTADVQLTSLKENRKPPACPASACCQSMGRCLHALNPRYEGDAAMGRFRRCSQPGSPTICERVTWGSGCSDRGGPAVALETGFLMAARAAARLPSRPPSAAPVCCPAVQAPATLFMEAQAQLMATGSGTLDYPRLQVWSGSGVSLDSLSSAHDSAMLSEPGEHLLAAGSGFACCTHNCLLGKHLFMLAGAQGRVCGHCSPAGVRGCFSLGFVSLLDVQAQRSLLACVGRLSCTLSSRRLCAS
jgi:hypothetical protein